MSKPKGISDGRLMTLWRSAVLAHNNHRCLFCGMTGDSNLECHHVVRRRRKLLRYDYRNGVPLCSNCHRLAHTKAGEMKLMQLHRHYDYCVENEQVVIKDWLVQQGKTESEWLLEVKQELLDVTNMYDTMF